MRGPSFCRLRRALRSRGTAVVEFALVMPVFFGIIGIILTMALATMVRLQMADVTHHAVRSCATRRETIENINTIGACINQRVQQAINTKPNFFNLCNMTGPQITAPVLVTQTLPPVYRVGAKLSCVWSTIPRLEALLPGGVQPLTLQASSNAITLPRYTGR